MKRYLIWITVVYILLLIMPLPLLNAVNRDKDKSGSASSEIQSQSSPDSSDNTNSTATDTSFCILNTDTGSVTEVAAKDFVIGSVSAEMYPSYHSEALKAQAVASYTYYSYQKKKQQNNPDANLKGADFADKQSGLPVYYTTEQLKERWGSHYEAYYNKISEAVNSVFGKIITYENEPIVAVYHAISAGTTEDAGVIWQNSYPYLQPVASPGDKLSPSYQTTVSVTPDELSAKLKTVNADVTLSGEPSGWLGEVQTSSSGTVTQFALGEHSLTGIQMREALGLKSACFSVKFEDGNFHFTVYGYGHNVGMSQYGADYLARQGSGWEEILKHYYTGVAIADNAG